MTRQMERNKKTTLLFVLAALQVCSVMTADCPNNPDPSLNCYTDYIQTITCVWNSTYESEHTNARCTLHAKKINKNSRLPYSASCVLDPAHVSRPALRNCSLEFEHPYTFQSFHELSLNLNCDPAKNILSISYWPACHIKLNPPAQPRINFTTNSWPFQLEIEIIDSFKTELQWKRWDQSWSDPAVQTKIKTCKKKCETQLDTDLLVLEEKYEARSRVQAYVEWTESMWSDWSPTASWSSPVGIARQPSPLPSGLSGGILLMIIVGAALALILAVMLIRNDKATWIYGKIRGPDPGKSFLKDPDFQNWLSPHFTNEFFLSSMKPEDIASVEVVSTVDAVTLCSKEAPLLEKMRNENSSSFLNPSYSHLFPPTCSPPTTANLEPCAGDTPHGASHSLGEGKNTEQDREEEKMKELKILQLLSKGNNSEPVPVVSDYEKVEKLQVQCIRLQSLDSGMCSGEEVSEERMEADNSSANESQDKGLKNLEEEKDGGNGQINFQKLFGGSVFGKGSIQICSDYKPVQMLQPESPELPSLDSGVSSGGEERVSHEESLEDVDISSESTHFLFPPPLASSALQHSGLTLPQQLPKFFGLSPALRPPSPSLRAGGMEPSGDGYMPARQEPC